MLNLLRYKHLFFILIYFWGVLSFAGSTGKIVGTVKDTETGEKLPGINIIIDGTTFGAATDVNGEFFINNIPPGSYTVIASGVGFTKKQFVNVKVVADFTTRLDFEMSTEDIELETIVVEATTPLVRKDLTSSQTTVDASQIESLPVESISGLLTLQAGVVQGSDGALHIRGGRSNEIQYNLNGVSISDPFNNSQFVSIATNAVQELSVVSGTFNAEYGNALSGVVNTITKEGGRNYNGSLSFYSGDYLSTNNDLFYNIDDIDPFTDMTIEGTLGGPIPFLEDNFSFFVSGRYVSDNGYFYGIRRHLPSDSVYKNPADADDIRISANGDGSIVPMSVSDAFTTTGKFTYRPISTIKLNYDVVYSQSEGKGYSHAYKYVPDALPTGYNWGIVNSIELRHAVSKSTFYVLKGFYNFRDYKSYLYPLLDANGNEVDYNPSMDVSNYHADPRYQPEHKSNNAANYTFEVGGTSNGHSYRRTTSWGAKFDITSQLNNNHEVKYGFEFRDHILQYEFFTVRRDTVLYFQPTILGTETAYHDKYTKHPDEFSTYLQDKMEFESLVINAGLRYDYFHSHSQYSIDRFNPSPNNPNLPTNVDPDTLLAPSEAKHMVSPRLGVSFPITDKGMIHFSYGHFYQMPNFSNLYTNPNFEYSFATGSPTFGNADLEPQQTVHYEVGLQQELMDNLAFNVTTFYKDVRDLLATQQIRISENETYYMRINKDYANIKGITFSLTKRRSPNDLLGATLDYTYTTAEGNDTDADAFFLDLSSGRQPELVPVFLDWDQTHTLNSTISFGNPGDWNATFVVKLYSGLPYTPQLIEKQVFIKPNSGRKPTQVTVNFMAEKTFNLLGFDFTMFLRIYNLFDALNEVYVFSDTGRSGYTLQEYQGDAQNTNELSKTIPYVEPVSEYFKHPEYYQHPRLIKLGISVDF